MAHPARPSESRKAQHHPAVVLAVVVVTVETVVVVVCTLIPPAFQQTQAPTFTNGGGSCRRHGSFSIGWFGARHFQIFGWFLRWTNNNKCRNKLLGQMKQPKKTQTHWKRRRCERYEGSMPTDGQQVSRNRLPLSALADVALLASPLFSSLLQVLLPSYPPMSTRTHSIQQPGCHPSFFTWTLRCFMAFPFSLLPPHTHTHTQRT